MPGGGEAMLKLRFDWYIILTVLTNSNYCKLFWGLELVIQAADDSNYTDSPA